MTATDELIGTAARVRIYDTIDAMGAASADAFAGAIAAAVSRSGGARVIFASAPSQLSFWHACRERTDIPWERITAFHMDEYIGLPISHPGSLQGYLRRCFLDHVHPAVFNPIDGNADDPGAEAGRYSRLLATAPIDVCVLGIGENGHIAFNDPPADFETADSVAIVTLVEAARRQQVGEGHFPTVSDVPERALTLTVPALLSASTIIGVVPDQRKAVAVRDALRGPLTPLCPASILARKANATIFLDRAAASLLGTETPR